MIIIINAMMSQNYVIITDFLYDVLFLNNLFFGLYNKKKHEKKTLLIIL